MADRKNSALNADLKDLRRLSEFDDLNLQVKGVMVAQYIFDIHNYWSMVIDHKSSFVFSYELQFQGKLLN